MLYDKHYAPRCRVFELLGGLLSPVWVVYPSFLQILTPHLREPTHLVCLIHHANYSDSLGNSPITLGSR
jgi:hypothetical protein